MAESKSICVAKAHDIDLVQIVRHTFLDDVIRPASKLSHGWIVLVVNDEAAKILSCVARMSDLTDSGVSIVERLELNRQPFPELNVIYIISPTLEALERVEQDFAAPDKPRYASVFLYFLSHASDLIMTKLEALPNVVSRLKELKELNVDFMAKEKCIFSIDQPLSFHSMYSLKDTTTSLTLESAKIMEDISDHLVSVCATLEEYPYVRYKSNHARMEQLAQIFQTKMNAFVANNQTFTYAPERGTMLFLDRGQDLLTPFVHESTFQAMVMDLLDVEEDQITYPVDTNAGITMKTALLNENDKLWAEFRHTHIAQVSDAIGKRMASLSASAAGASLKKGTATDISSMAEALRELPEYREILGKLSQHLYLAGKSMELFTGTNLLQASSLEQNMAIGVDESGKKLKHSVLFKQLEEAFSSPKLTDSDRARILAIFLLSQDEALKDADKRRIVQAANVSIKYNQAITNLQHLAPEHLLYKQNSSCNLSADEMKQASKQAETSEYSNARYAPKVKGWMQKCLQNTLDEQEFPYIIAPPIKSSGTTSSDTTGKKKLAPISLRKKTKNPKDGVKDEKTCSFSGEKLIVVMLGGASYSEIRSVYEVREVEKRDILFGTTCFLEPKKFLESLATLHKPLDAITSCDKSTIESTQVEIEIASKDSAIPAH
uniref:Syntaxinbinding protein putative n=1 Tax=Albugo laibachii Nc14 TaxID=890382 RepID=F0W5S8_9STRA|nr:syntaxinbinding protein putative [Albugo laibachii Nc14]|eukprot:CCA16469.1 syntaxinbinding protein putative [Albugo laibachii Nc14]